MTIVGVAESVDISAPREAVFAIVTHRERRLQLSPMWGTVMVCDASPEYPQVGSCFHTCPTGEGMQPHDASVTACEPGRKFAYMLCDSLAQDVTWTLHEVRGGTRLRYEEAFEVDDQGGEDFIRKVREAIVKWLTNIKRYAELHTTRTRRLARWAVDRYYLNLRPDQRNVIATIVAMHVISGIAGIMAVIAFGFTRLFM